MPLFTAKLTDEEMRGLRAIAAGRPMVEVLRGWIAAGETAPPVYTADGQMALSATPQPQAQPGVAAEGWRGGLHDLTPIATGFPDGTVEFADGRAPKSLTLAQKVAAGLAAPDDDCMSCGHDRQAFHTGTPYCLAPVSYNRGGVCRCPAFVDSSSPF